MALRIKQITPIDWIDGRPVYRRQDVVDQVKDLAFRNSRDGIVDVLTGRRELPVAYHPDDYLASLPTRGNKLENLK
jgi:hypothetical protein